MASPYSRDEVIAALEEVHAEVDDYFRSMTVDDFVRRPEEGVWSPAENLIHLIKSVKAVSMGLGIPKLFLAIRFRRPKDAPKASRRFEEVVEIYHAALARGGRASGPFVPKPPAEGEADEVRSRALAGWEKAGAEMIGKLDRWNEKSLDRYRLPHPLIGNLTVREILLFTLYHNGHHLRSVHQRLHGE